MAVLGLVVWCAMAAAGPSTSLADTYLTFGDPSPASQTLAAPAAITPGFVTMALAYAADESGATMYLWLDTNPGCAATNAEEQGRATATQYAPPVAVASGVPVAGKTPTAALAVGTFRLCGYLATADATVATAESAPFTVLPAPPPPACPSGAITEPRLGSPAFDGPIYPRAKTDRNLWRVEVQVPGPGLLAARVTGTSEGLPVKVKRAGRAWAPLWVPALAPPNPMLAGRSQDVTVTVTFTPDVPEILAECTLPDGTKYSKYAGSDPARLAPPLTVRGTLKGRPILYRWPPHRACVPGAEGKDAQGFCHPKPRWCQAYPSRSQRAACLREAAKLGGGSRARAGRSARRGTARASPRRSP